MRTAWKFVVVGVLAALLIGLAYAVAMRQSHLVSPPHDFAYYLAMNALGVVIILATPAFGLFIVQRSGARLPGWLSFWIFAYLVYLVYVGVSPVVGISNGSEIVRAQVAGLPSWID